MEERRNRLLVKPLLNLEITAEANCWQKQELYKGRGGGGYRGVGSMPTPRGGSGAYDRKPFERTGIAHDAPRPFGLAAARLAVRVYFCIIAWIRFVCYNNGK